MLLHKRRILILFILMLSLGMATAGLAAASRGSGLFRGAQQAGDQDPYLELVSEMTGMQASYEASGTSCAYNAGYQVYLCTPAAPEVLPQADPAQKKQALEMLLQTGLLLIPDWTNDRVMAFDRLTGDLVDENFIPSDPVNLSSPKSAILSEDGLSVLVSDQLRDVVQQYDLDGNYIGVFAPAGGPDPNILDNILGIALRNNGNLLVPVTGGTNQDSVAEFDTGGSYLGNFVAIGSGGLDGPFDVYGRVADWLVPGINSDAIHRYDLSGAYLSDLTAVNAFPEQVAEAGNGNVLVANFSGTEEGILEYTSDGVFVGLYNPVELGGYRGVYELPNGNLLTTTGTGVYEIDRAGNLVETKISGVSAQYIELGAGEPGIQLNKTVGLDPDVCSQSYETFAAPGEEVTYCYRANNTGEITLTLHTLEDSQLGTLLLDFPYALTPGSSAFITQSQVITASLVNTATWTAYNPGPIDVVSDTDTAKVNLLPAACPAGYEEVLVASAYFDDFPPDGWTITNTTTGCTGIPEWTNTDPGGRGNLTGGSGNFAIADSDDCGSGSVMTTTMTSAALDFSGLVEPKVTFYMDFRDYNPADEVANFDVSLDGGLTWQNIFSWNDSVRGPLLAGTALPGAGEDDVMVRWDYRNADWAWWWQVDDVLVTACAPSPDIEITPDEISGTQVGNQVVTHTLTISNLGIAALDWMVLEEAPLATSAPVAQPEYAAGSYAPSLGPAPADGIPTARGADGIQDVQAVLGSRIRSLVFGTHDPFFTIFELDTPGILPSTAVFTGTGEFIGAGEFVDGMSYMVDVTNAVFVVDDTGALLDQYPATPPPAGQTYSGMALDPATGDVYAASTNVLTSTLFTFDVLTGQADVVGEISGAPGIIAISFDGAGNLFGYDIVNDEFMQIDPATGNSSNVVPLPFDANFGQGMGFDPATGLLYILAFNNAAFRAELWSVDTNSPALPVFTFVDELGSAQPGGLNQLTWGGTDNCFTTDVPWLSVDPTSGTTGAGLSDMVDVTFDSTGLLPDVYTGALCVRSNDPGEPVLRVPLTLTVELGADLSLVKTASKEPVNPGETFEYSLVVENAGPDPATNVVLVDTLPAGVTFVSATAGCSQAGGVVTCDLGTLAVGASAEVSIVVSAPLEVGVITNSASVSADELDINPTDNSASLDTTVTLFHVYLPLIMR